VCAELYWGDDESLECLIRSHGNFELIVGAEVVFWPQAIPLLFQTVHILLSKQVSRK